MVEVSIIMNDPTPATIPKIPSPMTRVLKDTNNYRYLIDLCCLLHVLRKLPTLA